MSIVINKAEFHEIFEAHLGSVRIQFTRDPDSDSSSEPSGFFHFISVDDGDEEGENTMLGSPYYENGDELSDQELLRAAIDAGTFKFLDSAEEDIYEV